MNNQNSNSITLPIKKTTGETLEERMSENAYQRILPARYQRKNQEGELVEEQEEVFERVAKNIALADALYEAQRLEKTITITPKNIKDNHSSREDLVEKVFGEKLPPEKAEEKELKTELTEHNIKHLSYDNLLPDLPQEIANHVENVKQNYQKQMENLKFIPNTPTIVNAGDELQMLAACFVDSPEDDMKDIHQTGEEAALIQQGGGGIGFGIWRLRPKGDTVGSSGGKSSGPISFMRTYDQISSTVQQGGCVSSDTRVMTSEGYKRISELHHDETKTIDKSPSNEMIKTPKGDFHSYMATSSSGSMQVYRIVTQDGFEIKGSKDHLVLTINKDGKHEFKELQEINENETIVLSQDGEIPNTPPVNLEAHGSTHFNANEVSLPEKMNEDVAFFLGYLWADGSFNSESDRFVMCVANTEKEQTLKDRLIKILEDWEINYKVVDSNDGKGDYEEIRFQSCAMSEWMVKNRFQKDLDRIPEKLYQKPEFFKDFLAGMTADSHYNKDARTIEYSTVNKNLAKNLQDMLMSLGIPTKITVDRKREGSYGEKPLYRVSTRPGKASEKYDKVIPHPYQDTNLGEGGQRQNRIEFAEELVKTELRSSFEKNNKLPEDVSNESMRRLRRYERGKRIPSRETLKKNFEEVNLHPEEVEEEYYYDKVSLKTVQNNVPVHDIEVIHDEQDYVGDHFITHNVRRGAQMSVMRVSHPDVLEFIHSKDKDVSLAHELSLNDPDDFKHNSFKEALEEARSLINEEGKVPEHLRNAVEGHLSNFNISVGITDDFMQAVKNDEMYTFTNPKTEEPFIANEDTVEMYEMFGLGEYAEKGETLSVPAKELWKHIIEGAHENGEPGVVYLERMNKQSSFDHKKHPEKRINSTNPCLTGDMKVAVADGRGEVEIQKLAKEDKVPVFTHNKKTGEIEVKDATAFKTKENAETIEIQTDGSTTLELTPDHEVYTNNRGKVEAQNLEKGDSLVVLKAWNTEEIGGEKSAYRMLYSKGHRESEHRLIADHHTQKDISNLIVHHKNHDSLDNRPENLEPLTKQEHKQKHDISGENNPLYKLKQRGEFEDYKERSSFYDTKGEDNPMYGKDRKIRVDFQCTQCEKTIQVTPHEKEIRKYCSNECRHEAKREKTAYECTVCGEKIETIPSIAERRRYCSRQCANKELEQNLTEEGKQILKENMIGENNPMKNEEVVEKKIENTDYEKTGEKVSQTRKELIENGELEKEVVETEDVECLECGEEFTKITNTHLNSKHDMTTDEYREKYPEAEFGDDGVRLVKENHKVTSINKKSEEEDVYDMTVPDTHNFYAGKNTLEKQTTVQKYYVKLSNCGEEPLFEYDACNLSHVNLSTILDEDCSVQDYREFSDGRDSSVEEVVGEYLDQVVDWGELDERVFWNTRFLDNVVTMCDYPIPEIEETTRKSRKIGLGIMGFAQMLIQMGVEYGSDEANEIARQLMDYINNESVHVSRELAVNDGKPGMGRGVFEDWDKSKWADPVEYKEWFEGEFSDGIAEGWEDGYPIRNHTTTTLAPTGTTSMIGNTSGGCEPIYSVANFKNVSQDIQGEDMLVQFDDMFLRVLEANDIDVEEVKEEAKSQMDENEFDGVEGLESVPDRLGELFVTTQDLSALEHAGVQCAFQEGVSSAISKTINAPKDASVEDAMEAFEFVYDNGGKGVTYYRDGSRSKQVLTTRRQNKEFADEGDLLEAVRDMVLDEEGEEFLDDLISMLREMEDEEEYILEDLVGGLEEEVSRVSEDMGVSESKLGLSEYRKRPDNLVGATVRVTTGYGTLYVTLNEDGDGELFEMFAEIGKSGGLKSSFTEGISRMVSMALRYGVPPERIVKHLSGIKSAKTNWDNGDTVHSVPDGIALALERYLNAGGVVGLLEEQRGDLDVDDSNGEDKVYREFEQDEEDCPGCGGDLVMEEGCETCHDCGYSKC